MAVQTPPGTLAEGLGTHRKSNSGQEDCPAVSPGCPAETRVNLPGRDLASRARVRTGRAGELGSHWLFS